MSQLPQVEYYRVIERLPAGEGHMAEVFLAEALTGVYRGQHVALKVARSAYQDELKTDAERLSSMRHPHVIQILPMPTLSGAVQYVKKAAWNGHESWCMALEYAAGGSLREWLERNQRLPLRQALSVAYQALLALDYLHSKDLVHNDVKPTNILFAQPPQDAVPPHVLLADFGISTWLDSADATGYGAIPYVAPEKLEGTPGDERSDLYAIGAVLYEMLVGHAPFGNAPDEATQQRILEGHLQNPQVLERRAPGLAPIVMKALAHSPEERYQSAEEMLRALEDVMGRQPATSTRAPAIHIPWFGLALVALLVGLVGFWLGWDRSRWTSGGPSAAPSQEAAARSTPEAGAVASGASATEAFAAAPTWTPAAAEDASSASPTSTPEATIVILEEGTRPPAATPTSLRLPTSTPVPEEPTPTVGPTTRPRRTAAATRTAPAQPGVPALVWLLPQEGTTLTERPIEFRWEWTGNLGSDLYFQIRIRTSPDPSATPWGLEVWRETTQNTSIEPAARAAGVQAGEEVWVTVAVGRVRRDRSGLIEPVLAESQLRPMVWQPTGSTQGP